MIGLAPRFLVFRKTAELCGNVVNGIAFTNNDLHNFSVTMISFFSNNDFVNNIIVNNDFVNNIIVNNDVFL